MKIKYILLLILFVPLVFAQTLELNKNDFSKGETIIGYVDSKYPFTSEFSNINVHVINEYGREISSPFFVSKLTDSKYVIYFTIPETFLGNIYTLRIDNIYYVKDGVFEHFVKNEEFTINKNYGQVLSVDPGGVYVDLSEKDNFYLNLKNTGSDKLSVSLKYGADIFDVSNNNMDIESGDNVKLTVKVKQKGENIIRVEYNNASSWYDIRVYGGNDFPVKILTPIQEAQPPKNALGFTNIENGFIKTITGEQYIRGVVRIKNNWDRPLTNLNVGVNSNLYGFVSASPELIPSINPGEEKELIISVNGDKNIDRDKIGEVVIESVEGARLALPVTIYYKEQSTSFTMSLPEENIKEEPLEEVKTEEEVAQAQKEVKLGVILSLVAILFVLVVTVILLFKMKRKKPVRRK